MRFRFALDRRSANLVREFKHLNSQRTPGMWSPEDMVFPPGDPDRLFLEFLTQNAAALIAVIETHYVSE